MQAKSLGLIGCGNMGKAIVNGILSAKLLPAESICACTAGAKTAQELSARFCIRSTTDLSEAAKDADILILAVKPDKFPVVIPQIRDCIKEDALVISIAAGLTLSTIEGLFGRSIRLIRVMPNTPAMVGASMSALTPNPSVTEEDLSLAEEIFAGFGRTEVVSEKLMDVVTGVSGSSPAYVYLFIEAMADAAVADGMPRAQALTFAAQSVMGAAKMVLETGKHPGELKDAVCSPGGTTIEAVAVLEEEGLRSAVIKAQRACVAKSKKMSEA